MNKIGPMLLKSKTKVHIPFNSHLYLLISKASMKHKLDSKNRKKIFSGNSSDVYHKKPWYGVVSKQSYNFCKTIPRRRMIIY